MIGFLKGRLALKQPPNMVVDVNGVGYELEAPMSTFYGLPAAGEPVALYTHLVVREDAHILFGFGTDNEVELSSNYVIVKHAAFPLSRPAADEDRLP